MPNLDVNEEAVSVALLYQTSQLEGHLKDALKELGAAVVYEALTADMDRDALEGSGAHVVIVNLDPEMEAHLDEVYDLLDDERYNVVFNDAQVSVGLSGWDQARWSRHLAAKIMGKPEVSDPPRPAGSQAPPSPAQKTAGAIPNAPRSAPVVEYVPDAAIAALFPEDGDLGTALGALLAHADTEPGPKGLSPRQADPGEIRRAEIDVPAAPMSLDVNAGVDDFAADIAPSANPVPAPRAQQTEMPDFAAELDSLLGGIPTAAIAGASEQARPVPPSAPTSSFDAELDALANAQDFALDAGRPVSPDKSRAPAYDQGLSVDFAESTSSDFDFAGDLDALFEPSATESPASLPAAGPVTDFDLDLDALFADKATPQSKASAPTLELPSPFHDNVIEPSSVDIADLADISVDRSSLPSSDDLPAFDADFPALFDSLDTPTSKPSPAPPNATTTGVQKGSSALSNWSLESLDETDSESAAQQAAAAVPSAERYTVEKISSEDFLSGSNWSLEDVSEGAVAVDPLKTADTSEFGVERVAAQDFLAPEGGDAKAFDFSSLPALDLVPLEESVAPHINRPETVVEHRLDDAKVAPKVGIRNVVVLGASIGGPEAVREYLAALPARFPALFVLAQHMGAEFLDLMAAQLAKATKLTVRTASHGERLSHGEVVVVPTTHRLLIEADGTVQLAHLPESSPYSPSIDLILRDIADRFGAAATAIIFSGMAHDAIDGSKHLASKGGKVWVQDPDTCVISSMVDGAREAGVVTFIGAPAQLAQQTIATYGKA